MKEETIHNKKLINDNEGRVSKVIGWFVKRVPDKPQPVRRSTNNIYDLGSRLLLAGASLLLMGLGLIIFAVFCFFAYLFIVLFMAFA